MIDDNIFVGGMYFQKEVMEMGKFMAEWLSKWLKENKRHRTANDGGTLACPTASETIDIWAATRLRYCPLCGTELGDRTSEKNNNFSWEH